LQTGLSRPWLAAIAAAGLAYLTVAAQVPPPAGVQDPAWSPDGRRLAFSFLDQIWTSNADGRDGRPLRAESTAVERDPSFSPDGKSIAFAEDAGRGFDIVVAPLDGRSSHRLTALDGDERWPSWTRDGRVVFSHRSPGAGDRWRLHAADVTSSEHQPLFADTAGDDEREGRVSPDGTRVVYVSDRDSADGDTDLWIADLKPGSRARVVRSRILRARGRESAPAWAPDGSRIAFFAVREGVGSVWVTTVEPPAPEAGGGNRPRARPAETPTLVSRRGGSPAWSPDGRRLAVAELPAPDPSYNGNPRRNDDEPPPLFADAFRLWMVDAPLPVDSGARSLSTNHVRPIRLVAAFDRVWTTLQRLYYSAGASADAWEALKRKWRPRAEGARDQGALEAAIDGMIAEQPLIKPAVTSSRAVVVSGHPLASRAGAAAIEKGGNVVDAAIAASFALGVVEPDASGIGGDGMAVLYLNGMSEPVVVDYKDQVPIHATRENEALQRSAGDGPSAANIPGVVAGLDLLYRRYGSRKVAWADLIAPAIDYAEHGFELDAALPTSIAEGRRFLERYEAARRIYLPAGRVPRTGETFVNKDYAATLGAIAKDGAETFYRGAIARRIVDDMTRHGGLITLDDLAQYRAIERRPLAGRYRGHAIFAAPPPVSTGAGLIETLQILQNYRPRPTPCAADADCLHYAIESWKARDQSPRIADPGLWDVNLGSHLDPAHAASLFKRIDPRKALRYAANPPAAREPDDDERIGRGTTAFAVADADGNMIAITQTLSTWGGTFYVSDGLGFLYNNHLRFGGGAAPGRFLPLARSSSTSVPTLVFRSPDDANGPGAPVLAAAAAGNAWIPASVYGLILNVIDGGLSAQQAIEAPRFLIGRDPVENDVARILIEDRIPRDVLLDLAARGHRFQKIGRKGEVRYGYAAIVTIAPGRREVQGGADPRRSHAAVGIR
jgi:gamma-glutamyltranspeptidase / glutathione hydrolase